MGYGTQAMKLIIKYFQGEFSSILNGTSVNDVNDTDDKVFFFYFKL